MVDLNTLCMGCMEEKGDVALCPLCGYQEGTPPESPLHLPPRTELHGQYFLGRVLGHGGFGITYLGWDLHLQRKIAVKEYLPGGVAMRGGTNHEVTPFSGDLRKDFEYGLERFLDEARTVARFQTHPSIVSVLNFFRANGTAYIVMEYLDGVTLERYLDANQGAASIDTLLPIASSVLDALQMVHEQGILHRDISPDNIHISRSGAVKILDFGAARYALGQKSRNLSVILKEGYAPVEQYHSKGNQGPWTDIYSVSATMYRALTGKIPPSALDRMQGDDLIPPSQFGIALTPDQENAILKALAVSPEHRFHTVESFKLALTGNAAVSPIATANIPTATALSAAPYAVTVKSAQSPPTSPPVTQAPLPLPKTPLPKWIWPAAGGVLVAVIAFGGWSSYRDNQRALEAQQQRTLAQLRLDEEIKRQKELDASFDKRRIERQGELATIKRQEEELEKQRRELAAAAYDTLLKEATAFGRARNYPSAIQSNQQAIKLDPARPDAYSNIGWINLYGAGNLAAALTNYTDARQRGGTVFFRVRHIHSPTDACEGNFGIGRDHFEFVATPAAHNFRLERTALKEILENKPALRPGNGDFHLLATDNRRFDFLPITNPKPVRDMILQLAK